MSKILVVSYSWSGTTRKVAGEIVDALGADFAEIQDPWPRGRWLGYVRASVESLGRGLPSIRFRGDLRGYGLVVLGTPVWAGSMASPMRSFLFLHAAALKRVGCFCTMGGRGAERTLEEMMALTRTPEAPTFAATEGDVRRGRHADPLRDFTARLQRLADGQVSAVA